MRFSSCFSLNVNDLSRFKYSQKCMIFTHLKYFI